MKFSLKNMVSAVGARIRILREISWVWGIGGSFQKKLSVEKNMIMNKFLENTIIRQYIGCAPRTVSALSDDGSITFSEGAFIWTI